MLGSKLLEMGEDIEWIAPTHKALDLHDLDAVETLILETRPRAIIYAAGIARPMEAETNPEEAYFLNTNCPGRIAAISNHEGIQFCYISSNAVFDGLPATQDGYREEDKPFPSSVYGKSKYAGEQATLAYAITLVPRAINIFSSTYTQRSDFVRRLITGWSNHKITTAITDEFINPIYSSFAARSILYLVKNRYRGILHIGGSDILSNRDFVRLLADKVAHFVPRPVLEEISFATWKARTGNANRSPALSTQRYLALKEAPHLPASAESIDAFLKDYDFTIAA